MFDRKLKVRVSQLEYLIAHLRQSFENQQRRIQWLQEEVTQLQVDLEEALSDGN